MSLRISAPSKDGGHRGPGGEQLEPDFYMARVIKLIPAEAVAVYPLIYNQAKDVVKDVGFEARDAASTAAKALKDVTNPSASQDLTATASEAATRIAELTAVANKTAETALTAEASVSWLPVTMAWIILLMVILVRWQATRGPDGKAQWGAVAIAAISFFLWVPATQGTFGVFEALHATTGLEWPTAIKTFIPELLLIFWTILVPVFYKPTG